MTSESDESKEELGVDRYIFPRGSRISRFQVALVLSCCYLVIDSALFVIWPTFSKAYVPFECAVDAETSSKPGFKVADDKCSYTISHQCDKVVPCVNETHQCRSWHFNYSDTDLSSSMRDDFSLVCEREFWVEIHGSTYFAGLIFGSLFGGFVSDRIGRMKTARVGFSVKIIFGLVIAFTDNFTLSIISFGFVSMTAIMGWVSTFTYICEVIHAKNRHVILFIVSGMFGVGVANTALTSWLFPNWRHLTLAATCSTVLSVLILLLTPESPRWLWSMGRYAESVKIIKFAARFNSYRLTPEMQSELDKISAKGPPEMGLLETLKCDVIRLFTFQKSEKADEKSYSVIDILKHKRMRFRFIILSFHWIAANTLYYGILFGAALLGQPLHVYIVVQGAAGVFGCIIGAVLLLYMGRRPLMITSLCITGASVLSAVFIDPSQRVLMLISVFIGKFFIKIVFSLAYMWTGEMMPTVVRSSAVGSCSMIARITGLCVPYYKLLSMNVWEPLTLVTYSAIAFLAMITGFFLPETRGKVLPDTLEEGEAFGGDEDDNEKGIRMKTPLKVRQEPNCEDSE